MTAPALAAVPDKLPEQQTPSVRTEITEPDYRAQKTGISGGYEPAFLAGTTTEYRR